MTTDISADLAGSDNGLVPSGQSVLVSCFDAEGTVGGGLFTFAGTTPRPVDHISTTGLDFDGNKLLRCVWNERGSAAELLVYDQKGLQRYIRVDGVSNPHDVRWLDDDTAGLVATAENCVLWLSASGDIERRWQPPGEPDSWHLNSLVKHQGRLYACAFGRYVRRKGWDLAGRPASGCMVDLESGLNVVEGLRAPHSPRFIGDSLLLCNSHTGELVELDATTKVTKRRQQIGKWPRGLAVTDEYIYVGLSPARGKAHADDSSQLLILTKDTWEPIATMSLEGREVYDLVCVPDWVVRSVERAAGTNATRTNEQAQRRLFEDLGIKPTRLWALGDPLPGTACRVDLQLVRSLPDTMESGKLVELHLLVRNVGSAILTPAPPHPVGVVSGWCRADGSPIVTEALPSKLPYSLPPGEELTVTASIRVPNEHGHFHCWVTLEQYDVTRFDAFHEDNRLTLDVVVT
jgi:acetolactate synthase I/II/III large subunit